MNSTMRLGCAFAGTAAASAAAVVSLLGGSAVGALDASAAADICGAGLCCRCAEAAEASEAARAATLTPMEAASQPLPTCAQLAATAGGACRADTCLASTRSRAATASTAAVGRNRPPPPPASLPSLPPRPLLPPPPPPPRPPLPPLPAALLQVCLLASGRTAGTPRPNAAVLFKRIAGEGEWAGLASCGESGPALPRSTSADDKTKK